MEAETDELSAARRDRFALRPLLRRLLPPLAALMLLLMMVGASALLWYQQRQRLTERIAEGVAETAREFQVDVENHTAALATALHLIAADENTQKAMRKGDAEQLWAAWRLDFEVLRREHRLTHLQFNNVRRVCILRLQQPHLRGDVVTRPTACEAERTGRFVSGIELDSSGTLILWGVRPVFADGELVGFVELGKDVESIVQLRQWHAGLHVALALDKEFLDRNAWEARQPLGRESEWDRMPGVLLPGVSSTPLAEACVRAIHAEGNPSSRRLRREVAFDGRVWQVSVLPLQDTTHAEIGSLLLMQDLPPTKADFAGSLALGVTVAAALLGLVLGAVYLLLRRKDAKLRAAA